MRVLIYEGPTAPPEKRFVGLILERGDLLPVRFIGRDPDELRTRVEAWWAEQLAKVDGRKKPRARAKIAAAPFDAEPEEAV